MKKINPHELENKAAGMWQVYRNYIPDFWADYEALIEQSRMLFRNKPVIAPVPVNHTAKRLVAKYWVNKNKLPELHYVRHTPENNAGCSVSLSLITSLFALATGAIALFTGVLELAVGCMVVAMIAILIKMLSSASNKPDQKIALEIKIVVEPHQLVYHFRGDQAKTYNTVKIRYDWIAGLQEEGEVVRIVGHKKQETWQGNTKGVFYPVLLYKDMADFNRIKFFLQELVRHSHQQRTR
ncbi:hypothetical protein [uncultured Microscilla sp.]|uniref:hypothetical protein n=1 Tax=uncultured Microscilla sp. TaxID=432653 RepID=UPI002633429E|nr:hypothetical protein [uncultured Microscilla sp.]